MTERRLKKGLALLLTLCLVIPVSMALADQEDALEMQTYWQLVGDKTRTDALTRAMVELSDVVSFHTYVPPEQTREFVAFLSEHFGKVVTYTAIIREIWGYNDLNSTKKLQVNMANIRKKFGDKPGQDNYIVNELGVGYRMCE